MFRQISISVLLIVLLISLGTAAQEDHPLVTRYEGSQIVKKAAEEFASYKLVTGVNDKGEFQHEPLEGRVTRIVYTNPADRSTLEIYSNYGQALAGQGMETIFACALDECGPAYARSAWSRFNGLFAAADGDPRYLAGTLATGEGVAYVALMVGKQRTQLDIVEILGMQEDRGSRMRGLLPPR